MKQQHQVAIADHLWNAFEEMALEMGTDRDALVNQAMHMFARLNGYLTPDTSASAMVPRELEVPSGPPPGDDDPQRRQVARQVLETANALERAIQPPVPPLPATESAVSDQVQLYLMADDGGLEKVTKDRFIIGRGKHCDLVVDGIKVSREHAAIVREGNEYFIEDLSSANGTWFKQAHVQRRKIADGDEYFISSEKIRCVLR